MSKKKTKKPQRQNSNYKKNDPTAWIKDVFDESRDSIGDRSIIKITDFDPIRKKRRIEAVKSMLEIAKERIQRFCPDLQQIVSFERTFVNENAKYCSSYEVWEDIGKSLLGASIWALDRIKENDCVEEILQYLPKSHEQLKQTNMPPIFDLEHSTDMIAGMYYLFQNRNQDCIGLSCEKEPDRRVRLFTDLYTTQNMHKQDVLSRNNFEAVMSYIPQADKEKAAKAFENTFWDFVERFYKSRNILARQQTSLVNELNSMSVDMDLLFPKWTYTVVEKFSHSNITSRNGFSKEAMLLRQVDVVNSRITELSHYSSDFSNRPYKDLVDTMGEEIAQIWKDFTIEDPYELCFGLLYAFENNSDLPWLYTFGTKVMTLIFLALPWSECIKIADIFAGESKDNSAGNDVEDAADDMAEVDKLVCGLKPEDWYSLDYMNQDECDTRCSLSQIIYNATKCIIPREASCLEDSAVRLFKKYGVKDPALLKMLAGCSFLLNSYNKQNGYSLYDPSDSDNTDLSDDEYDEDEYMEEDVIAEQGALIAELQEQIALLKKENSRLKSDILDAERKAQNADKKYEELEQQTRHDRQELADLRELVFNQQNDLFEDKTSVNEFAFPYQTKQRIVVFGGHDSWVKEIKLKLPNVRFVGRTTTTNVDMIRKADVVWIQSNAIPHGLFYKIINEVRKVDVPLRYFSFASATKCAKQIVKDDVDGVQRNSYYKKI